MSTYYPISVERMLKISDVGNNKLRKYGNLFIDIIKKYVLENIIEIPEIKQNLANSKNILHTKKSTLKKDKEDTKMISYNLYKDGIL